MQAALLLCLKQKKLFDEMIVKMRASHNREPRRFAKSLLREKAAALEPEITSKLKFARTFFANAFRRMGFVVWRISSTKAITNEDAAQFGRFFCLQIMELRQFGFSRFFPDNSLTLNINCENDVSLGTFVQSIFFQLMKSRSILLLMALH